MSADRMPYKHIFDACLHTSSFVILNGAAGGVKDLMYDNVQEMYPPDSSLSLRMTEREPE